MKNGNESWDVLGDSRKRYRGPWAEIGKYWPGKEPIRLQDSLPCPLKKKKKKNCYLLLLSNIMSFKDSCFKFVYSVITEFKSTKGLKFTNLWSNTASNKRMAVVEISSLSLGYYELRENFEIFQFHFSDKMVDPFYRLLKSYSHVTNQV